MLLKPKNWEKFQHYKDRCPPWIKLHRDLLNDRAFTMLPTASKALAPLFWLLASESKEGVFDASDDELEFRLRVSVKDIQQGRKSLIDKGFFVVASNVLAECLQPAIPEKRREEGETEHSKAENPDGFDQFWSVYPNKVAKPLARQEFKKAKINGNLPEVIADVEARAASIDWQKENGKFVPKPSNYLKQRRWEDGVAEPTSSPFAGAI